MHRKSPAITREVLIIDEDKQIREGLRLLLEFEGYTVSVCESGKHAFDLIGKRDFEVILVDYRLPHIDGVELTKLLRNLCPDSYIVGFSRVSMERQFLEAGADVFLGKHQLLQHLVPLLRGHRGAPHV